MDRTTKAAAPTEQKPEQEHNRSGFEKIRCRYDYDTRTTRLTLCDLPDGTVVRITVPGFDNVITVWCDLMGMFGPTNPNKDGKETISYAHECAIGTKPGIDTLIREGRMNG